MNRKAGFTRREALAFGGLLTAPMLFKPKALAQTNDYGADSSLIAAAKKEGSVVWYTTQIIDPLVRDIISPRFNFEVQLPVTC